ncbi:Predicted nucleotidyltransferases [Aeromonas hydrophila]|nr:Predicted nucleotidyltransferases [Aeromonas hydrophila]
MGSKAKTIGDIVELVRGNTYKSALLDQPGPVLLGLASIERNGGFRSDKLRTYGGPSSEKHLVYPGDMYVSLKDITQQAFLLGSIARVPNEINVGRMTQDTVKLLFKDTTYSKELFYWVLRTPQYKEYCKGRALGTTNLSLSRDDFLAYELPEENKKRCEIVNLLENIESKTSLSNQINKTLEQMAQTLFKSWFVDFDPVVDNALDAGFFEQELDLPDELRRRAEARKAVRAQAGFKPLPAATRQLFPAAFEPCAEPSLGLGGWVPQGWENIAIYSLAEFVNGAAYKAFEPNLEKRGLPIIKIAELKSGVTSQTAFSDQAMPEKYRLTTGDILFSWSGNPDTSIDTFVWTYSDAWLNQHIFKVTPPNEIGERSFVLTALKSLKPIFADTARNKQTTGLGHVTVADLKRLQIIKPESKVLAAWDHLVSPYLNQIHTLTLQTQTLAQLRDTLLPKLISGELSLDDIELTTQQGAA